MFDGEYYAWWKARMLDFLVGKDMDMKYDFRGPRIPMRKITKVKRVVQRPGRNIMKKIKRGYSEECQGKKILICKILSN